jgi:hypothetical protein
VGPHPLDEGIPAEIETGESLLGELAFDHILGSDPRVIGAGKPECPPAAHALEADQYVLDRVVETVTHMQRRRDVRRWHHDHVRLAGPGGVTLG